MRYYLHLHNIKHEINRNLEQLFIKFIWRLPNKIAYWCAIRVGVNATTGKYSNQIVPDLSFMDALQRWES